MFPKYQKILKDYKSKQNPLEILKGLKECFFGKVAGPQSSTLLKDELHYKFFQLIYLPFKSNCLSRKTSKKTVWILQCNVHYVTQGVLLLIFSCCTRTFNWPMIDLLRNKDESFKSKASLSFSIFRCCCCFL